MALILDNEGIQLIKTKYIFDFNNFNNIINLIIIDGINNKKVLIDNSQLKTNSNAFFDEEKYFYWITYDNNVLLSGHSNAPIQDDIESLDLNTIGVQTNDKSPFESMGYINIKYIKIIRNTKYIYYQIELNSVDYYGVIDIKENQILFNTNETITEFRPLSKYSLLAITKSSAYEICINGKKDGKCIDKCPRGQYLRINSEKGNYCDGNEECDILLIPNNTCIGICDEQYYIMNGKECGLCKHLNKEYPYKIINEATCIKEKPKNTYFYDESSYILKNCHSSCETCKNDNEFGCLTCKDSFYFINGKCDSNCPEHTFKNKKKNICSECDSNCKDCDNGKENNNSHCLTCYDNQYLVIAKGFDNNCVDECPNNTKSDNNTKKCLSEKDDVDDNNNTNSNTSSNNSSNRLWLWIIIILVIIIIIIVIVFVIFKKGCFKKKNEDDVNLVLKSQDDFGVAQNESISQDWSVY